MPKYFENLERTIRTGLALCLLRAAFSWSSFVPFVSPFVSFRDDCRSLQLVVRALGGWSLCYLAFRVTASTVLHREQVVHHTKSWEGRILVLVVSACLVVLPLFWAWQLLAFSRILMWNPSCAVSSWSAGILSLCSFYCSGFVLVPAISIFHHRANIAREIGIRPNHY